MTTNAQNWRQPAGILLLILSVGFSLSALALPAITDWSTATKVAWAGGLAVSGEVCGVGAIALLGKGVLKRITGSYWFRRWQVHMRRCFSTRRPREQRTY